MYGSPRETLLPEIRQKKSENDYMIMTENFNKNLEQKRKWAYSLIHLLESSI